jgi:hypothetical protein
MVIRFSDFESKAQAIGKPPRINRFIGKGRSDAM